MQWEWERDKMYVYSGSVGYYQCTRVTWHKVEYVIALLFLALSDEKHYGLNLTKTWSHYSYGITAFPYAHMTFFKFLNIIWDILW